MSGAGGGQRKSNQRERRGKHLATCSRFTPDLHFGAALQEAARQEQLDLTRLGAGLSEAQEFSRSNEGALVASG